MLPLALLIGGGGVWLAMLSALARCMAACTMDMRAGGRLSAAADPLNDITRNGGKERGEGGKRRRGGRGEREREVVSLCVDGVSCVCMCELC